MIASVDWGALQGLVGLRENLCAIPRLNGHWRPVRLILGPTFTLVALKRGLKNEGLCVIEIFSFLLLLVPTRDSEYIIYI